MQKKQAVLVLALMVNAILVAGGTKQILSYDANEKETVVADSIAGNDLVVAKNGNIYVTSPDGSTKPGKLYLIQAQW